MNGKFKFISKQKFCISVFVLLELGIITIPLLSHSLIKLIISSNLKLSLFKIEPSRSVKIKIFLLFIFNYLN